MVVDRVLYSATRQLISWMKLWSLATDTEQRANRYWMKYARKLDGLWLYKQMHSYIQTRYISKCGLDRNTD